MVINDEDVFKAIEQATDAPNHGMRGAVKLFMFLKID